MVVCSDPTAVLKCLQSTKSVREDLLFELYVCYITAEVAQMCSSAHERLKGNEQNEPYKMKQLCQYHFGGGEGKTVIKKRGLETWQKKCDEDRDGRRRHKIQMSVIAKCLRKEQKGGSRHSET